MSTEDWSDALPLWPGSSGLAAAVSAKAKEPAHNARAGDPAGSELEPSRLPRPPELAGQLDYAVLAATEAEERCGALPRPPEAAATQLAGTGGWTGGKGGDAALAETEARPPEPAGGRQRVLKQTWSDPSTADPGEAEVLEEPADEDEIEDETPDERFVRGQRGMEVLTRAALEDAEVALVVDAVRADCIESRHTCVLADVLGVEYDEAADLLQAMCWAKELRRSPGDSD